LPRKKSSGRKKRKSTKRGGTRRVALILFAFTAILFGTIYYISFLKQEIELDEISETQTAVDINSEINRIDKSLYHILFDLGITKKDILRRSSTVSTKGDEKWEYKETEFNAAGKNITTHKIETELSQVASNSYTKATFKKNKTGIVFDISVEGLKTHKLIFDLEKKSPNEAEVSASVKNSLTPKPEKQKSLNSDIDKKELFASKMSKVVIIVDDLGRDKTSADRFSAISTGLTFSILPDLPHSSYVEDLARKKNMEVMLHLPMEPKAISGYNADDAGEGVLMVGQTKEAILRSLDRDLSAVPTAVGVNNHMGSKFTESRELMELVLRRLKSKGMFFVDSLTTSNSQGYEVARELGMKEAKRDYFLDDKTKGKEYVKRQLDKLVAKSEKNGFAIGICHPYPTTIEAFEEEIPRIRQKVQIVPVSEILK